MASLSKEQIHTLVELIKTSGPDQLDCDECFGQIGEFAETELENRDLCDAMKIVQRHLQQCPCCRDEYEALLQSLREAQKGNPDCDSSF